MQNKLRELTKFAGADQEGRMAKCQIHVGRLSFQVGLKYLENLHLIHMLLVLYYTVILQ